MSTQCLFSMNRGRGAVVLVAAGVMLSCSSSEPTSLPPPLLAPGPAIRLEIRPSTVTLLAGENADLLAQAYDSVGRVVNVSVEWSSSDPSVATIGRTYGSVSAIAVGSATMVATAGTLTATAFVTVRPPSPAASISIALDELIVIVGDTFRLSASVTDAEGHPINVPIEWTSEAPDIAAVGATTGLVTGVSLGLTRVIARAGSAVASISARIERHDFLTQWAVSATASSQYGSDAWAAWQATGTPDVLGCDQDYNAWASKSSDQLEWIELTYAVPVRATQIRIYEVWAPGSVAKVEVKDLAGTWHQVYSAVPNGKGPCLRTTTFPVTRQELVTAVRVTVDQRTIRDWNEIDAVRLRGYRNP